MGFTRSRERTMLRVILGFTVLVPLSGVLGCEHAPAAEKARQWAPEDHDNFEEATKAAENSPPPSAPRQANAPRPAPNAPAQAPPSAAPSAGTAGKGR